MLSARHVAGLAVALLLPATQLRADDGVSQRVHRCVGARGEVVFSGLPCGEGDSAPIAPAAGAAPQPGDGPAVTACPASAQALRDRVGAAVARHDANALAGLIRWQSIGGAATGARLKELNQLVQRPLLAIDAGDEGAAALRVRTGSSEQGGVHEHQFSVADDGRCWWLGW